MAINRNATFEDMIIEDIESNERYQIFKLEKRLEREVPLNF